VGRLGADAVATVGLTESMLALIYAVAMGLSMGAAATVARRIGEKDPERAAAAAVQSIGLGIAVAVPIGISGALLAPRLLTAMGAQPSVIATGSRFTAIMLGANVVILLLFLINAIFRGAGDASMAMHSLWLANIVNLVLDPCFIFGLGPFPKLGVTGAAVATCIGRGSGVLPALEAQAGPGRVVIGRRHLSIDPRRCCACRSSVQRDRAGRRRHGELDRARPGSFRASAAPRGGTRSASASWSSRSSRRGECPTRLPRWWDKTSERRSRTAPNAPCGSRASTT
jgi:hypothetical protein